jgi:hypothetical protein
VRSDVFAASLDSDTESHESRLSHSWVGRAHVDLQLGREDGEDLLRGKGLSESIETSESEPGWGVLLGILWVVLGTDR